MTTPPPPARPLVDVTGLEKQVREAFSVTTQVSQHFEKLVTDLEDSLAKISSVQLTLYQQVKLANDKLFQVGMFDPTKQFRFAHLSSVQIQRQVVAQAQAVVVAADAVDVQPELPATQPEPPGTAEEPVTRDELYDMYQILAQFAASMPQPSRTADAMQMINVLLQFLTLLLAIQQAK